MPNIAITKCCNLKCPYCFADEMIHEDETNFITMEELDIMFPKNKAKPHQ